MASFPPLQAVYDAFSRYRLRLTSYCEHCFDRDELVALRQMPLRERMEGDLPLASLLNTLGDANDFKHLLPRLLELFPVGSFEREVVDEKLLRVSLAPEERATLDQFFGAEVMARLDQLDPLMPIVARFQVQPLLALELEHAPLAPWWYAQLVNELGGRHASSSAQVPFTPGEQVLVDWVLAAPRFELLERAFFDAETGREQSHFSTALDTLQFWVG